MESCRSPVQFEICAAILVRQRLPGYSPSSRRLRSCVRNGIHSLSKWVVTSFQRAARRAVSGWACSLSEFCTVLQIHGGHCPDRAAVAVSNGLIASIGFLR